MHYWMTYGKHQNATSIPAGVSTKACRMSEREMIPTMLSASFTTTKRWTCKQGKHFERDFPDGNWKLKAHSSLTAMKSYLKWQTSQDLCLKNTAEWESALISALQPSSSWELCNQRVTAEPPHKEVILGRMFTKSWELSTALLLTWMNLDFKSNWSNAIVQKVKKKFSSFHRSESKKAAVS